MRVVLAAAIKCIPCFFGKFTASGARANASYNTEKDCNLEQFLSRSKKAQFTKSMDNQSSKGVLKINKS